jgi:hypothetical protein
MTTDMRLWRRRFVELTESLYRLRGETPPAVDDAFDGSWQTTLNLRGIRFRLLHDDPDDTVGNFLLQCHFCKVPPEAPADLLQAALELNHALARQAAGMFVFDADQRELIFSLLSPLQSASAPGVMRAMEGMVPTVQLWRSSMQQAMCH